MYYLIHLDPPYWGVLETSDDSASLEKIMQNHQGPDDVYPSIPAGELYLMSEQELNNLKKELPNVLYEVGEFSWDFGSNFFIETHLGNYIWSDPDYNGDNTLRPYPGSLESFLKDRDIPYVRDKGKHIVRDYCGPDVKVV